MAVPVLRFYVHTLSDIYDILPSAYACPDKEIQIVLAFAIDYDKQGNFRRDFDNKITPQQIEAIKKGAPASGSIKFFLSIGGRDPKFPFAVSSPDQSQTWINNATDSLRGTIQEYHIDGIDVYYQYIDNSDYFASAIAKVIENLKGGKSSIVTKASITVSYPLREVYVKLYKECAELLNNVVYQCFTVINPSPTPKDFVNVFHGLVKNFPRQKILAGYSDWLNDQATVAPDIFAFALAQLLGEDTLGISKWHGNPAP